jgi:chromosome segregation ATPase
MASDEKRMSESLIDNVQRKLLEKISSQALHLGNLNNDLREAAEYIKICELKLANLEEAVSASQSQRDSQEQSNLENKALIQKLLLEVEDKGQKHNQCEKKLADSRREAQKIRVQLETAQHSLRLASQPSGQADHENQLKVNARLRSEVMALNSKIRSYKDQLQAMQSAPLHQETFEVLSRKSRVVCDAATLGKLVSINPEKSPALNSIHRLGKQNEGRYHSSVGSAVDDKCSPQSYKKIATQDNIQCTSHEGEREIVRRDAAAAMRSADSDAKLKTLEDERDALLDYIQVSNCIPLNQFSTALSLCFL